MAETNTRKKPIAKMALMGILSFFIYVLLFQKQDIVNTYFIRGGVFAFLPIAAAFLVSYVHGSFTGHFWTVMGIEARKKRTEGK